MKLQFSIQWSYAGRTPEGTPAEESAYYTGAEQDQSMQARLDNKHSGVALGLPQRSRHTASSHSSDRPPDCANRDAQFGGALGMTPADRE